MSQEELVKQIAKLQDRVDKLELMEMPSHNDPFFALIKSQGFLKTRCGQLWVSGGYNRNISPSPSVESLLTAGITSGDASWQVDDTRGFPYVDLDRSGINYMYDNTSTNWGAPTFISSFARNPGMTVGVWFKPRALYGASYQGLLGAWNDNVSNASSWRIMIDGPAGHEIRVSISDTGTYKSSQDVYTNAANVVADEWQWAAFRYDAGTSVRAYLYQGDSKVSEANTTSIVSSIFDSQPFFAGSYRNGAGTNMTLDGHLGQWFVMQNAWETWEIEYYYEISRQIYGV